MNHLMKKTISILLVVATILSIMPIAIAGGDGGVYSASPSQIDSINKYTTSASCTAGDKKTLSSNKTLYAVGGENNYKCGICGESFYNDALLMAHIESHNHTLTYNANGGSGAPSSQKCLTGCNISSIVPSRFGYTFLGWSKSKTASTASYIPGDYISFSENTTLYAVWEKAESADGIVSSVVNDIYFDFVGQALYYEYTPDKTRTWSIENFCIEGNDSGKGMGIYLYNDKGTLLASSINQPESNQIVYELEAGKKYYIKVELTEETGGINQLGMWIVYNLYFDANGGSGAPSTQIGSRTYTIPSTVPIRNGYEFLGWSTDSAAESASYKPGEPITIKSHTILYAVWEANTSGKCGDNLTWTFDEATGTLTISGTGDMYDWPRNWQGIPWRSVKDGIKSVVIKSGVTSIGECAFIECYDLISVSISSSVTNIKRGAFAFCNNLKNITIPDSVTEIGTEVFVECTSLKSLTIPDGVKSIELSTFSFCSALTSVTIPDSVTKIDSSAFEECSALTDVYYEGSKFGWDAITIEDNNADLLNANIHFAKDDIYNATFYLDSSAYNLGAEPIAELVFAHGSDMTACFAQAERGIASLKPGKKFVGWKNIDTGEIVNKNAKFTEDVEFYAVWTDYNSTVTIWGRNYETGGWRVISTKEGAAGTVFKINTLKSLVTEANYGTAAAQFVAVGSESTFSDDTAIRSDFVMPEGNKDVYIFTQTKFDVEFRIPEFDENGYITEDYYSDVFSYNSATDDTFRTVYITAKNPINAPAGYKFAGWRGTNGILYSSEKITLDYANGTSYEFTAEYIPAEYTIEFVIDNSAAIKEIYKVEGTFSIGDKIRLSDAVVTKEDGTRGRLPVIGKENKEQLGGPYKNVDGYKFAGWKVGTQAANHVDFDITQEITITPEFIESVTFNDKILIKGYWEALSYDFVAYYAKSFDADGNPVYEAMPAVKVKIGANLGDYLAAATETANENLPEGKKLSLWRTEDGSAVPDNMPAYGLKVYATYISESLSIFIDYNYFSKEFVPDVAERVVKSYQFSKYLYVGVDIENDIPDNEIISVAEMVRRMKIPDSLKPEGDYVLSRWKVYHVHDEAEVYDERKWHEGYNDEGTSIAKHPVIFQALWTDGLSGACGDDLTFVFDKDSGILTVNGTGDMWDWELFKDMPWYNYINDIEFVDISDGVTSIGDNAFYNCQKLEDVVIPDSVTKIGKSAFHNCTSLKDVIIPEGVTLIGEDAFYSCESIENITIPYGITAIGYRSFYLCNNLKSITIPVTVTSIGNYAFASCNRLTDVYFEGSKAEWNSISIGEENVMLLRAKIHYADCDHNFVPSVTVPATCTENGVMTYTCECGDSFTEEIPATGHVPGNWNVSIPASCTVDGESVLCCEECGIVLGNKNIPATGHVPGFWVIVVEPTTETEGSKIKCCDICGDLLEEETIAKLPPKEPVKDNAVVKNPSTSTISYGDAIILHVDASKIPEGGYVEWTASNGNFSYKPNDATCEISPKKSGDTTFTATVYDANGNAVSTDEQTMTSKAGFFDKIIAFFKGLFGLSKTYPSVFKGIF